MADTLFLLEVFTRSPIDSTVDASINTIVTNIGGRFNYRELPEPGDISQSICLSFEFDKEELAEKAATDLRSRLGGHVHVEGPYEYG